MYSNGLSYNDKSYRLINSKELHNIKNKNQGSPYGYLNFWKGNTMVKECNKNRADVLGDK